MILNKIGETIGISVNALELNLLGSAHPNVCIGCAWIVKSRRTKQSESRVLLLPRAIFSDCVNGLIGQAEVELVRCKEAEIAPSEEFRVMQNIIDKDAEFFTEERPNREQIPKE